jgi:hypothetical protein
MQHTLSSGFEKMVGLFVMLGISLSLAVVLFHLECLLFCVFGLGKENNRAAKSTNLRMMMNQDKIVMREFREENRKIWRGNPGSLELARRLRLLADDIEMFRFKAKLCKRF